MEWEMVLVNMVIILQSPNNSDLTAYLTKIHTIYIYVELAYNGVFYGCCLNNP
jgi:hypothetical protein